MGVPGFFKWLAQRYPLICETYRGSAAEKDDAFRLLRSLERSEDDEESKNVPDGFDNLYLDVNGIVHNCSHSIEELCQGIRCEEDIFILIFQYINNLVKIVRPRQLLYLAVDGVAPRAKIVQQRDRRYRSARDRNKNEVIFKTMQEEQDPQVKVEEKDENQFKFDPIEITPGTPFMQRLSDRLKYFAHMMIHENKFSRNLKIVVSGSDVPGEGEHKIMEYIRNDKARRHDQDRAGMSKQYVSHCIYGLDADLILLALATHEPYICLLREQIYFSNKHSQVRMMMNMNDYVFLHIGILREYLLNDMILSDDLRIRPRTIDRVIDDFVFISLFMGNDFLPHGKFAKIQDGGLNTYLRYYAKFIDDKFKATPFGDIWLVTGCGEIHCFNLLSFLHVLSRREYGKITDELKGTNESNNKHEGRRGHKPVDGEITVVDVANCCISKDTSEFKSRFRGQPTSVPEWRSRYYLAKMGIASDVIVHRLSSNFDPDTQRSTIPEVVRDYLVGLQWVMDYYYHGVPSWTWHLRCKYPPLIYDVKNFLQELKKEHDRLSRPAVWSDAAVTLSQLMDIRFDLSSPVTPFEQLMMVLPPSSAHLLPSIFASIITDPESPLKKYYPENFDIDMDDTNVQWGGVTLLPVVPPMKLRSLMNGALHSNGDTKFQAGPQDALLYMESSKLSEDEKLRNGEGIARIYYYDPTVPGKTIKSPMKFFPDILHCQVTYRPFYNPTLRRGQSFPPQLMMYDQAAATFGSPSCQRGYNIWFPSLNSIPFTPFVRGGVQIFQMKSYLPSLFLWIKQPLHSGAVRNFSNASKAKYVTVGYPYQHIGRLEAIYTPYVTIQDGNVFMGNPRELADMLVAVRQDMVKRGIVVSLACPDPNIHIECDQSTLMRSAELISKMFIGLPGCALTSNMPSVQQAKIAGLDNICENVVVQYRLVDINLQDTTKSERAIITFVRFVDHVAEGVPQLNRTVYLDEMKYKPDMILSNQLNEMVALKNAVKQHELTYGRFSKPLVKVICVMEGSLYGCVGAIRDVGNTFEDVSAVFPIPDYTVTIAANATHLFERHVKIALLIKARPTIKWYKLPEICQMLNMAITTASATFHLLTSGTFHDEVGMNLVLWNEEKSCVMCLPGYTRCSNEVLVNPQMADPDMLLMNVEYSEGVLELVSGYRERFPEIFEHFDKSKVRPNNSARGGYRYHINLDHVFTGTPEVVEYKKEQLQEYLAAQPFRRLKLTVGTYSCYTEDTIEEISTIYDENSMPDTGHMATCVLVRLTHIKNFHIPSFHTGTVFMREEEVRLGLSVVYINHNEAVPLGTRGTIVGIYPQNPDGTGRLFELILDRPYVGASQLFGRCGNMRGVFVSVTDILPIFAHGILDIDTWYMLNQAKDRANTPYISYA
ncbi:5'-3' exoribonuclease 1 [Babesia sp. Xinjiang]|uniref:5'-3' exoribonuclease 1 n=1 Tax=Babesia sp. Xinjiang TaxID=462227 RepID=UPI000A24B349|nr:5'-3' exoribonuclease 1 [Babesia sp. Xinjiang]XP_028871481.1 5'-3' exoribonuclease 1 [Babesia sp. Xinjiang]ORM40881.1 5'-3' exoribonuclease 1 [Babesia sp. Xinjiang]ORM41025.1 5'-3' exoribonuclease 1 [Babesia sp. Xinjiang]